MSTLPPGTLKAVTAGLSFFAKAVKSKLEEQYFSWRLMKARGLVRLEPDFQSVYFHTLYNLFPEGNELIIKLFSLDEVQNAFREQFFEKEDWKFKTQLIHHLHTNKSLIGLKGKEIGLDALIDAFLKEFRKVINESREPKEAETHQKVEDTNKVVHELKDMFAEQLQQGGIVEQLRIKYAADLDFPKSLIDKYNPNQALEFLTKFKENNWETADGSIKCKVLSQMGICHLQLNQEDVASEKFIEAVSHNPEDSEALGFASLGYALIQDEQNFEKAFKNTIKKDKENELAYAGYIHMSRDKEFKELLAGIPRKMRKKGQVAFSLSQIAMVKKDYPNAIKWMETAHKISKDSVDIKATLATILLESVATPFNMVTKQFNSEAVKKIERAIVLLTEAWETIKDSDVKKEKYGWLLNRGVAKKLLGDSQGAYTDILAAAEYKRDYFVLRHLALAAIESEKYPEAIKAALEAKHLEGQDKETSIGNFKPDDSRVQNMMEQDGVVDFLIAEIHIADGKHDEAIRVLQEMQESGAHKGIESEVTSKLIHTYVAIGDLDQAIQLNTEALKGDPDILKYLDATYLANIQKNRERALLHLAKAHEMVDDNTGKDFRLMIAESYFVLKEYEAASEWYESVIDSNTMSPYIARLVESYVNSGKRKEALVICKRLRTQGHGDVQLLEREVTLHQVSNDLPKAISLCEKYLEQDGEANIIQVRLALLYKQAGDYEKLKPCLNKITSFESIPISIVFTIAYLHLQVQQIGESLHLAYETWREHQDAEETHTNYVKLFLQYGEEASSILRVESVGVDTAVTIEDGAKHTTHILTDREDPSLAFGEISMTDPLAEKLKGKRIGEEVELKETFGRKRIGRIVEITSKYNYAKERSIHLLLTTFVNQDTFDVIEFGKNEKSVVEDVLEFFTEQADESQKHGDLITEYYQQGIMPIGYLSKRKSITEIDTWGGVVADKELGVFGASRIQNEGIVAGSILQRDTPIVLDIITIMTLAEMDSLDLLLRIDNKKVVTQSTIDVFNHFIDHHEGIGSKGYQQLFKQGSVYYRHEVTQEAVELFVRNITQIRDWCTSNCKVLPCHEALNISEKDKSTYDEILGVSAFESILLAKEHDYLLFSDEGVVRSVAFQEYNVRGISTQIFFLYCEKNGLIKKEHYVSNVAKLLSLNYKGLIIDKDILMESLNVAKLQVSQPFTSAIEILSGSNSSEDASIRVAVQFLKELYLQLPQIGVKDNIVLSVIGALTMDREVSSVIAKVVMLSHIEFKYLPQQKDDMLALIKTWVEQNNY